MRTSTLSATFSLLAATIAGCSSPAGGPPVQASSGSASGSASGGAASGASTGNGSASGSASGGSGAASTGGASGTTSGQSADGGCDLSLLLSDPAAACAINETYGVFVSPGAADAGTGAGTRASPLHSIDAAITLAKMQSSGAIKKRVYVCVGYYDEKITIDATRDGAQVYGALKCADWTFDGTHTGLSPSTPGTTLTLTGLTSAYFEDFELRPFIAPTAAPTAPGAAGASSIAVFIENSKGVVLTNAIASGSNAQPGQDQLAPGTLAAPPSGHAATTTPGAQTINSACMTSVGGAGGAAGQDGSDGAPGPSNKGIKAAAVCAGGNGAPGTGGSPGKGAATLGTLDSNGWTPANGSPGMAGGVGQGGGGGASGGGGGGPGGCGGAGGAGGTAGGSSIALLIHNSTVKLVNPTLQAGDAGQGGKGGQGQVGQTGGAGGTAMGQGCAGGQGGAGGSGGGGGGGAGGISAGIVWGGTTTRITIDGVQLAQGTVASLNAVQGVSNSSAAGGLQGSGGASAGAGAHPGMDGSAGVAGLAVAALQIP